MLYFIPAWYKGREWCENEQSWHEKRRYSEFDDTVKQIQLFHRDGTYGYQILSLGFSPNFRHFLHRQSVYRAPYWSCFDAIQEVRRKKVRVLSFHDLKWPEGIEFFYSPFAVAAMLQGEKYAEINFGEDGNPIWIALYQEGKVCRRNIYDDRGFISATVLYEDGKPCYQDYLRENGIWKLRHDLKDGHIQINEKCPTYLLEYEGKWKTRQFSKMQYDRMEEVIYEVFNAWLKMTKSSDIFCVAMDSLHAGILGKALRYKKKILSFFRDRCAPASGAETEQKKVLELIRDADYIVADSGENAKKIRRMARIPAGGLMVIPPYDTRADAGISLQSNIQKILLPLDGLEQELAKKTICILGTYASKKENVHIHLLTRDAGYNAKETILSQARSALAAAGLPEAWAAEQGKPVVSENDLEEGEAVPVLFIPEQRVEESSVSICMREQWLLVDLRDVPEQYLQINAVSFGIPQIVRSRTDFVQNGGNGIILKKLGDLPKALAYYLNGLEHLNEARVYCYKISRDYTTERLLEMWGEVMESVG